LSFNGGGGGSQTAGGPGFSDPGWKSASPGAFGIGGNGSDISGGGGGGYYGGGGGELFNAKNMGVAKQ
jgi:hypothetical protein